MVRSQQLSRCKLSTPLLRSQRLSRYAARSSHNTKKEGVSARSRSGGTLASSATIKCQQVLQYFSDYSEDTESLAYKDEHKYVLWSWNWACSGVRIDASYQKFEKKADMESFIEILTRWVYTRPHCLGLRDSKENTERSIRDLKHKRWYMGPNTEVHVQWIEKTD